MRLQRFAEHRVVPWKNGGGVTREVALQAPADAPSDFLWRISLATVTGSGPFSAFPGIDRTIAVLAGDGMRLTVDGAAEPPLTLASQPYAFSGDADVHADSIGGETTDLNIMTRRGAFTHRVRKLVLTDSLALQARASTLALVIGGSVQFGLPDGAVAAETGDVLLDLQPGTAIDIVSTAEQASVYVVDIWHTGP